MASRSMATTKRQLKLRWWQWIVRAVVVGFFALAGAYATFPWWAPTGYLSRRIAADLSRQMGAPVRIDGMSLSWFRGVEIRGLTIDSAAPFEGEPLATVRSIHTEFSPVELLLHNRLSWLLRSGRGGWFRFGFGGLISGFFRRQGVIHAVSDISNNLSHGNGFFRYGTKNFSQIAVCRGLSFESGLVRGYLEKRFTLG